MVNLENIPSYLKDNAGFCNLKYETRNGKLTKVPYNPHSNTKASVNDTSTFSDFNLTVSRLDIYDGIWIKVDGKLYSWSEEIIFHFKNTYIEISTSGNGLRILLFTQDGYSYDKENYYIKKGNVEVYVSGSTNRFVTITGNAIQNLEIVENMDRFQWLIDTYMKRENNNTTVIPENNGSYLTDDNVIQKAMLSKQGTKFNKLWSEDISDYPSQSEADLALISVLAFYCNGDKKQIDRLYRKSKLFLHKWDELHGNATYGNLTINKALSGITSYYSPVSQTTIDKDFDSDLSLEIIDFSKCPWTDIGSGMLFADFYQEKLLYVLERKSWFYNENGIWSQDIGGLKAMKLCMALANLLHMYALKITDEHKRKSYMDYSKKWQSHTYRVNILKNAQVYHPISISEFDTDPYIFNCKNGTINVKSRHKSSDKLTKISNVKFNLNAHSDKWNNFILEIMSGDKDKAKFLQKIFG